MKPEPKADKPAKPAAKPPVKPAPPKGRVFDVMRPGKAPASPTSRPVITGHKPAVQESLTGVGGIGDARPLLNPRQKVAVAPTEPEAAEPSKTAAAEPPVAPTKGAAPPEPTTAPEPPATTVPVPAEPKPKPPAETAPEPVAAPAPAPEPAPLAAAEPPVAPAPPPPAPSATYEPDPLEDTAAPAFDRGEVVVSRHFGGESIVKIVLILLLIVALALVAFDVMLDAGILNIQGIPHTQFLS